MKNIIMKTAMLSLLFGVTQICAFDIYGVKNGMSYNQVEKTLIDQNILGDADEGGQTNAPFLSSRKNYYFFDGNNQYPSIVFRNNLTRGIFLFNSRGEISRACYVINCKNKEDKLKTYYKLKNIFEKNYNMIKSKNIVYRFFHRVIDKYCIYQRDITFESKHENISLIFNTGDWTILHPNEIEISYEVKFSIKKKPVKFIDGFPEPLLKSINIATDAINKELK